MAGKIIRIISVQTIFLVNLYLFVTFYFEKNLEHLSLIGQTRPPSTNTS